MENVFGAHNTHTQCAPAYKMVHGSSKSTLMCGLHLFLSFLIQIFLFLFCKHVFTFKRVWNQHDFRVWGVESGFFAN